jgi:amidophosphoribosyltransferase
VEAVTRKGDHSIERPCMACMDGWYVTGDINETKMNSFEQKRQVERETL